VIHFVCVYDFGDDHKCTLAVLEKNSNVKRIIEEANLDGCETRVALVQKSKTKMPNQYGHDDDHDEEDGEY